MAVPSICRVESCGKPVRRHYKHGLCRAHYERWRKHGDPLGGNMSRSGVCRVESCGKPVRNRSLCNSHYLRSKRHGDPLGGKTFWDGREKHPLIRTYRSLFRRCYNKNSTQYRYYGGRGITICERWRNDFWAFVADMGPKPTPKHTIERSDNERGYEPGNCYWATMADQVRNKRNNRYITALGRTQTVADWERERGFNRDIIRNRISNGWSEEDAILTPLTRIRKHA